VITREEAASLADPETADHGTVDGVPPEYEEPAAGTTTLERPESAASRLVRLRQRLARSQSGLGRGLLALLSATGWTTTRGRTSRTP
jgi:fused signal recognition particle receptor